jgi:hypothetical protein
MNRIYHPWYKWEDYHHNFYGGFGTSKTKKETVEQYAELLRDIPRFEAALKVIISEWVHACEHNLTNESLNRVAYLGQAACALEYHVPHYVSCSGYNLLTPEEQAKADAKAQEYLDLWIVQHETKEKQLSVS